MAEGVTGTVTPLSLLRPRQAVILAGGRGTRLGPIGDRMPKAMVPFHGRPFLDYLLELLRAQGFERVLLLLGYRAEQIVNHVGNGARHGLRIEHAVSDVEDDTGRRIKLAEDRIEPRFLLLYCDNYWPMPFDALWRAYAARTDATAQVTVYRNRDGYTKSNLRVDAEGYVATYDKSRTEPGLAGVDIGFLIAERAILALLPDENVSFEATVYPKLVAARRLAAYETDHRYYSVGTPERLPETERFLSRAPTVLLDRDGVLNEKMPRAQYVVSPDDWRWLPGAREALGRLCRAGFRIVVVTNQAGIARKAFGESDLAAVHAHMTAEVAAAGGRIEAIYHCPHHWDDGCECRKPRPGMLLQAQRDLALDLSRTPFVGDDPRDGEAAAAAGCPFIKVDERVGLAAAVEGIIARFGNAAGMTARTSAD